MTRWDQQRVVKCKDNLQWRVQRLNGGKWRNVRSIISALGPRDALLALLSAMTVGIEDSHRCKTCGLLGSKPQVGLLKAAEILLEPSLRQSACRRYGRQA